MTDRYWITPPPLLEQLTAEFGELYDPCPYPRPPDFDGVTVPWRAWNYINPPFKRADAAFGRGPTAWARKAVCEHAEGRGSVLLLPTPSWVNILLSAGAELRDMGRIGWLDVESGRPWPNARPITAFILRPRRDDRTG